jgi:ATP-dependent protease HslVU (ClpYQ) peptidase subunit
MNKIVKIALSATVILSLGATVASADAAKGQKLYAKKLKKVCGFSGAVFAAKHTQDEWTDIEDSGKMADEIKSICPNVPKKALKSKYIKDYYDFANDFASDSGNVPSC